MEIYERWGSLGEHLADLRQTLIHSFIIIGIGFLICLMSYEQILHLLTTPTVENPFQKGLTVKNIQRKVVSNESDEKHVFLIPSSHIDIISSKGNLEFSPQGVSLAPGDSFVYEQTITSPLLILGPIEGLVLVLKLCLWISLAATAPVWGWVWLCFILPGLKSQEKAMLFPFLMGSIGCLLLGVAFAYYVTLPLANHYLISFNESIGQNAWTLEYYVNYVLWLCLGHAVASELGFLLLLLVHFRVLSPTWLIHKRRYMIVLAFIVGALLTPPDVLTQLMLAIPLVLLYEFAILYAKWRDRTASIAILHEHG